MLTILQIIEVKCPGLYIDTGRDIYIEIAEDQISECYYGKNYNLAVALLACHSYTLFLRNGDAGTISSKKEGDLSVSYSTVKTGTNEDDLSLTSFGMELKRLKRSQTPAVSVTGVVQNSCINPGIIPCE